MKILTPGAIFDRILLIGKRIFEKIDGYVPAPQLLPDQPK